VQAVVNVALVIILIRAGNLLSNLMGTEWTGDYSCRWWAPWIQRNFETFKLRRESPGQL